MGIFKKLVDTIAGKFAETKAEDFITDLSGKHKGEKKSTSDI